MTANMLRMVLHGTMAAAIPTYGITAGELLTCLDEIGCPQLSICPGCNEPGFKHLAACPFAHYTAVLGTNETILAAKDRAVAELTAQMSESEKDFICEVIS